MTGVYFALLFERGLKIPVADLNKGHAFTFTLDNDASCDALHSTCRQARHDLLPENGRYLVAVETIEHSACLLGIDQVAIEFAGIVECGENRLLGDLVEHHSLYRNSGVQHFEEMPRDRFAFAVFISCEIELVAVLEQGLELLDLVLLVRRHDIERFEVVIDIDPHTGPLLCLVGSGNIGCVAGQISDVTDR